MKTCPQCDTGYPDSQITCPTHGLLLNEIRELKPGMVIHKTYRIVRKLGQGGMGTVYLAQHIHMGEPRALKFLSPELSRDQAFTSRFLREVRTLRQIRNRNVVDCGDLEAAEDDSLFFSMEYVDGPDLRAFLNDAQSHSAEDHVALKGHDFSRAVNEPNETAALAAGAMYQGTASAVPITQQKEAGPLGPEGSLPVPLALSIARQIAEGLGAAHAKGMVHRDIKPENILMARDAGAWLPKIADFGIVATKESSTAYTRTGGTLLTMAYAAPEQWRGTPAASLDGRTDLYALGGLLYEMLTGQTPFHAENYEGWAHQHQTTPPPPPSTLRPDLANWQGLDALTFRLLAKDRNDRPANVAELLTQLDAVRLVPPEGYRETVSEDTAIDATHAFAKNNPKPLIRSGSRWVVAAVSMLLVALLVFALSRLKTSNELTDQKPTPGFIPDPDQKPSPKPDADKWEQYIVAWTDPTTGLMWTKKDNAREVNWKQATNYCRNLQLAGHSGWRLPTIDELQGIYDANANVGGYHVKGSLQLSNWFQWSSSHGNNSGQVWGLYFTDGSRSSDSIGISTNARVLCVRRSVE